MPPDLQEQVISRLIDDHPRVFWMTIISMLQAKQEGQEDE